MLSAPAHDDTETSKTGEVLTWHGPDVECQCELSHDRRLQDLAGSWEGRDGRAYSACRWLLHRALLIICQAGPRRTCKPA